MRSEKIAGWCLAICLVAMVGLGFYAAAVKGQTGGGPLAPVAASASPATAPPDDPRPRYYAEDDWNAPVAAEVQTVQTYEAVSDVDSAATDEMQLMTPTSAERPPVVRSESAVTFTGSAPADDEPEEAPHERPMARVQPPSREAPPPVPPAPRGSHRHEQYFPTGQRQSSAVMVQRTLPGEIRAGTSFTYELVVTNLTGAALKDVQLEEIFDSAFRYASSNPAADAQAGDRARWNLETLAPRGAKTLRVTGTADTTGTIKFCAKVTFSGEACDSVPVVQPALQLALTVPARVIECDPIPVQLVVSNPGTGVARGVTVSQALADGLTTSDGRDALAFSAGDLAGGTSRTFTAQLRAARTGSFAHSATAADTSGLTAADSARTEVVKPELSLTMSSPPMRFIGRPATFDLTITNNGDAEARDTVITNTAPAGAEFVEATGGGSFSGGKVVWSLGTFAPGASQTVLLTVVGHARGTLVNSAVARAYCADASAEASTMVKGIPAVLLEVIDLHDPIEVGANETYEVKVVNQGSSDGTNINLTCTIPPEQQYVSSNGPTQGTLQGQVLTFVPLPNLAPGATATYRVVVKGIAPADVRFKLSMTSDQAQVPVEETESTHIYE